MLIIRHPCIVLSNVQLLISKKGLFQVSSDVVVAVVADPVKCQGFHAVQSIR